MSLFRKTADKLNRYYTQILICGCNFLYLHEIKKLLKFHPGDGSVLGENTWIEKWRKLRKHPNVATYRLFSQYIGSNPNIVPEDISSSIIQPLLNPVEYRPYYCDKNMFDKILDPELLPKTLLRRIGERYYDAHYRDLVISEEYLDGLCSNCSQVFVKPTVDSSSGRGIVAFTRKAGGRLVSIDGEIFGFTFLNKYASDNSDFIVQEGLSQSKFMSQFNPTSINTLRIATYRSVKDNRTHVCAAIMRIGKLGATVDNAHAGGLFVGVNLDGTIGKYACDQYGNRYESFNGINFKEQHFCIPNFDKVIRFAEKVGDAVVHHRLLAQDICIDSDGVPHLVEFNIRAYSVWLFQFTSGPALGEYTDEIIDYCSKRMSNVRKVFVEPF